MADPAHVHGYRWCRPGVVPTRPRSRWGGRPVVDLMADFDRSQRFPSSTESMPIADGVHAVACSAHSCKSTRSMEFLHARSMTIELRGDHPSEITRTPVDWEGLSRPPSGHRCWRVKASPPSRWLSSRDHNRTNAVSRPTLTTRNGAKSTTARRSRRLVPMTIRRNGPASAPSMQSSPAWGVRRDWRQFPSGTMQHQLPRAHQRLLRLPEGPERRWLQSIVAPQSRRLRLVTFETARASNSWCGCNVTFRARPPPR